MNIKFDFNNHMVYNRIVQVINTKLDVLHDYERRINPEFFAPADELDQIRTDGERQDFGFNELSIANVNKLPISAAAAYRTTDPTKTSGGKTSGSKSRINV